MGTMEDVAEAQTSEQVQTAFVGATERWKARELKVSLAEPQRRALRRVYLAGFALFPSSIVGGLVKLMMV
nr:hypothetical protein Itr_chr03CG09510 [Ipomoea trifida]